MPDDLREKWDGVPWRQVIGLRNWLIHGYDGIDMEILWDVLAFRAAELVAQLDEIIAAEETR